MSDFTHSDFTVADKAIWLDGVKTGNKRERERIIKLLEDTAIKNGKGTKAIHWHLDKLIALIKGENK